ncbi:glycosyltransferase family 1 protein [Auriculariales sp. MPI-PUGE-AT-0066]|nr:glycosyltransferase family 1 protein [Auriculariales sp. MPI-PUGE-AT-0066]
MALPPRTAFVTVGATSPFDALLSAALHADTLRALRSKGFTRLEVQCGATKLPELIHVSASSPWTSQQGGLELHVWGFKSSLADNIARADLVISHAGSGTIVDVLRVGKPLLVVPNTALLHNHQEELATALHERGHLIACHVNALAETIEQADFDSLKPFPPFDGSRVQGILDDEMGFS